jgi:hypothetical protein
VSGTFECDVTMWKYFRVTGGVTPSHVGMFRLKSYFCSAMVHFLEIFETHYFVIRWSKMFREIVCPIVDSFIPIWSDVAQFHSVFNPVVPHVPGFRSFRFHEGGDNSEGCQVVCFDWCRWLWVTDCYEGVSDWYGGLCVDV